MSMIMKRRTTHTHDYEKSELLIFISSNRAEGWLRQWWLLRLRQLQPARRCNMARRAAVHGAATANRRFWAWRERPGRPSSTGLRRVAASCRHVCDAGCRSTGIGRQCHVMAAFATVARDGCRAVSILILRIASIQIRIRSRGRVSDGYAYGFGQRADRSGSVIGGVLRSHQRTL